jgi:hypothetical protein
MRLACFLLLATVTLSGGCAESPRHQPPQEAGLSPASQEPTKGWPKDWSGHVGKRVILEGTATNQKMGAALSGEGETIFIDGMDWWPADCFAGDRGKRVRVTGTVIERYDLPVFIPGKDELPRAGIPVPEGTDLRKASRRFLIENAKWTVGE